MMTLGEYRLAMLEQFSAPARRVVAHAEEEADRMGHPHTGTEHLLLGLLDEEGTKAAALLAAAGVTLGATREKVVEAVGPSGPAPGPGQLIRTARAQRALDRAARFARTRGEDQVGPEDILAGVLDVEGRAGQVLRGLGVDVTGLGEAVKHRRTPPPPAAPLGDATTSRRPAPAAPPGAPHGPRCPHCQADLSAGVAHRILISRGEPPGQTFVAVFCPACGSVLGTSAS